MSARTAAEEFLAWLDARSDQEPAFQVFGEGAGVPITVIRYSELPEPGDTLAFTFGVSEPRLPGESRTEMVLAVSSLDPAWVVALGIAGERVQGQGPEPGETIALGSSISEESEMAAFLVWRPLVLPAEDGEVVHLSNGHLVLVQLIPIHRTELAHLREASSPTERENRARTLVRELGMSIYDVTRSATR